MSEEQKDILKLIENELKKMSDEEKTSALFLIKGMRLADAIKKGVPDE